MGTFSSFKCGKCFLKCHIPNKPSQINSKINVFYFIFKATTKYVYKKNESIFFKKIIAFYQNQWSLTFVKYISRFKIFFFFFFALKLKKKKKKKKSIIIVTKNIFLHSYTRYIQLPKFHARCTHFFNVHF